MIHLHAKLLLLLSISLYIVSISCTTSKLANFKAGVSKIDASVPIGAPLAGYSLPPRRQIVWPLPWRFTEYTTWLKPSEGAWEPTWVKAVSIGNGGSENFCFVTVDILFADGLLHQTAYDIASANGFKIPFKNVLFSASSTHSGPGALTSPILWGIAPTTDILIPKLQEYFARKIAEAMIESELKMQPAKLDIGSTTLTGVTENRRANISPHVTSTTIDPNLAIMRIDSEDGKPLATLWNYAIQGTCFGPDNMRFSNDIMGSVSNWVEANIGGVALFMNADAGDIVPTAAACKDAPNFAGGPIIGAAIQQEWNKLSPSNTVELDSSSNTIDYGLTQLNLTAARLSSYNCTEGPLDFCAICERVKCDANLHLGPAWVEQDPTFAAFRFTVNKKKAVVVSIPGEALVELGNEIRTDTKNLGFHITLLAGNSNNYLGYFATPDEYEVGGLEAYLTLWGANTANTVREDCHNVAKAVTGNDIISPRDRWNSLQN